jgi:hypothetical protein
MKKIMTILGLALLMFFSVLFYENYIDPRKPTQIEYVDTCIVDTIIVDTISISRIKK